MPEDNVGVSYTDKETGKEYVIGYSVSLQGKIHKEIKKSNTLKMLLLVVLGVIVLLFGIIITTGVFGKALRLMARC